MESRPYEKFAEHQPWPEGPVVGPGGWILNVCSFSIPEKGWPARGGDVSATHVSRPLVTHTVFNTSRSTSTASPLRWRLGPTAASM